MKNKFTLIFLLVGLGLSIRGNSATLDTILSKYCVPKAGGCGDDKAKFTGSSSTMSYASSGSNYCQCGYDRYYDAKDRICKDCPDGQYTKTTMQTNCQWIECPEGSVLVDVTAGCPVGMVATSVSDCPVGFVLYDGVKR